MKTIILVVSLMLLLERPCFALTKENIEEIEQQAAYCSDGQIKDLIISFMKEEKNYTHQLYLACLYTTSPIDEKFIFEKFIKMIKEKIR